MGQLLRTVLIWLVAFAIPAQGMAAAAMLHCVPHHHEAAAAQPKVNAHLGDLGLALAAPATHGHASHAVADVDAAGNSVSNSALPDTASTVLVGKSTVATKASGSTYQKCSACASCCAGMALPSAAVMTPAIDPVREVTVLPQSWAASIVIDGPERPPRIPRA